MVILLNSFVQLSGVIFDLKLGVTNVVGSFVMAIVVFCSILDDNIKSKSHEKEFIYYISLQVLDDIDKERDKESNEGNFTVINEIAQQELAGTK